MAPSLTMNSGDALGIVRVSLLACLVLLVPTVVGYARLRGSSSWHRREVAVLLALSAASMAVMAAGSGVYIAFAVARAWWPVSMLAILVADLVVVNAVHAATWPHHHPCPHCGKMVAARLEWRCGACDTANSGSVLDRCSSCGTRPQRLACTFCHQPFALGGRDDGSTHVAREIAPAAAAPTPAEEQARREREIAERLHRAKTTSLDASIAEHERELDRALRRRRDAEISREWIESQLSTIRTKVEGLEIIDREERRLLARIQANESDESARLASETPVRNMMDDFRERLRTKEPG